MHRKILTLALPLLILLGTVTTVVALEQQRTPEWQRALNGYLDQSRLDDFHSDDSRSGDSSAVKHSNVLAARVRRVARARLPWNFRAEMGRPVRSTQQWPWAVNQLPYPPDALYCVLVQETVSKFAPATATPQMATTRRVIYVAHHSDKLWRVGWMVHEGPIQPFSPALASHLASVGCDLGSL